MAINAEAFLEAIDGIVVAKGISKEDVLDSLKEVLEKGLRKEIGFDDARVECIIDPIQGTISLSQIFTVVDDVEDDVLEIHIDDARKANPNVNLGDDFYLDCPPEDIMKSTAMAIKSMLRQKFAEAEKTALFEAFKDKIGTMITGVVEKTDSEKGLTVNIGKTTVFLPKSAMIGDETFVTGENIRLYVEKIDNNTKGARINVTRSSKDFLKCLFFEELTDVYNGTVEIKAIARMAGERSKVAVYSNDPNVDPAGTCIGPNGSKIQKVVGQLGNGNAKEKIDVIAWSENVLLFIAEALKPARVVGVNYTPNPEKKDNKAVVIVSDDSFTVAIGKRGSNVKLASQLTGVAIDIKVESEAIEKGIEYTSILDIQAEELALKTARIREQQLKNLQQAASTETLPGGLTDYVSPLERTYADEEEDSDLTEELFNQSEREDNIVTEPVVEEVSEEIAPVEETVEELEAVSEEIAQVEEEKVEVKISTNLENLEASLEKDKNKQNKKSFKKNFKKTNKEEKEEETSTILPTVDPSTYMDIYTAEELAEMDLEDEYEDSYDEDEVDYDEYDSYYDDDND